MQNQLLAIAAEFDATTERFRRLSAATSDDLWQRRPRPESWSVAECIAHLNLSGEAFVPLIRGAISGLPRNGGLRRYRHSAFGWMLWRIMPPPVRFGRAPTIASMVPGSDLDRGRIESRFLQLQEEQVALVRDADGLPIDTVRIRSPFSSRVHYNVYSALAILPRHVDRHLWQGEQALADLSAGSAP